MHKLSISVEQILVLLDGMLDKESGIEFKRFRSAEIRKESVIIWLDLYLVNALQKVRVSPETLLSELVSVGGLKYARKGNKNVLIHVGLQNAINQQGLNRLVFSEVLPETQDSYALINATNDAFETLCSDILSQNGYVVDYSQVRKSEAWSKLLVATHQLSALKPPFLVGENVKAFLINLYNLMVLHAKCVLGHPETVAQRSTFFKATAFMIAGSIVSCGELEHGVLRGRISTKFKPLSLDPRIHFVLNCGAKSCPPIVPLKQETLDTQLNECMSNFLSESTRFDRTSKVMKVSRLLKWYQRDFSYETDADLHEWISEHVNDGKRKEISDVKRIKFSRYDWAENGNINTRPDNRYMMVYDMSFKRI
mmetsp:Transcript_7691/g.13961  ORF Transcript_7691/g.13961 Transcript_7691/m.13961 type:complete len:366 (-) Transcript_7691:3124-4221(-)